jgi:hypothetical protein
VGTDSSAWQSSSLSNGDVVRVAMTSSLGCANPQTVLSHDSATMVVSTTAVTPSVTFVADHDPICSGTTVTFTAQPTNGGDVPGYQWKLNGVNVGYDLETYTTDSIHNGDALKVEMNSSIGCVTASIVSSPTIQVAVQNCDSTLPLLMTRSYPVKEGDAGLTTLNADVSLDRPATQPVSIHYATSNDDAIAGLDYVEAHGTLTIPVGATTGRIQLSIIGDLLRESNERFNLRFSDPVNAQLPPDPVSKVMIIDDDKGKRTVAANNDQSFIEEAPLKIPTIARSNQVWRIPGIGNYLNEITILNVQGQVVTRFMNYQNQVALPNLSTGLYFYRIKIMDRGQGAYYSGRLLISE